MLNSFEYFQIIEFLIVEIFGVILVPKRSNYIFHQYFLFFNCPIRKSAIYTIKISGWFRVSLVTSVRHSFLISLFFIFQDYKLGSKWGQPLENSFWNISFEDTLSATEDLLIFISALMVLIELHSFSFNIKCVWLIFHIHRCYILIL